MHPLLFILPLGIFYLFSVFESHLFSVSDQIYFVIQTHTLDPSSLHFSFLQRCRCSTPSSTKDLSKAPSGNFSPNRTRFDLSPRNCLFWDLDTDGLLLFCSKTMLKLTIPRIKLLRNKREIQIKQMRRDIAKLLETGQEATARIRVLQLYF